MKRRFSATVIIILAMTCLIASCFATACASGNRQSNDSNEARKISVVTTSYAVYDWIQNILGDNPSSINVTYLLEKGVDIHSFQPSAEDIIKINTADLFIYGGGQSDEWIPSVLRTTQNSQQKVLILTELLGGAALEEEIVEGMQDDDHGHDHGHRDGESHDHETISASSNDQSENEKAELDEHVWLSLKNAQTYVKLLERELAELDPQQKGLYEKNAQTYSDRLNDLDVRYQRMVAQSPNKTILVADRFPFRYLVHDYGLHYYAAFSGCYADAEASFETIAFLAQKVDEIPLHSIIVLEGSNEKIAHTIINTTRDHNQKIVILDSLQSVSADDIESGKNYFNTMERNLTCLQEALS